MRGWSSPISLSNPIAGSLFAGASDGGKRAKLVFGGGGLRGGGAGSETVAATGGDGSGGGAVSAAKKSLHPASAGTNPNTNTNIAPRRRLIGFNGSAILRPKPSLFSQHGHIYGQRKVNIMTDMI
jgi:hypothetical protein